MSSNVKWWKGQKNAYTNHHFHLLHNTIEWRKDLSIWGCNWIESIRGLSIEKRATNSWTSIDGDDIKKIVKQNQNKITLAHMKPRKKLEKGVELQGWGERM